MIRQRSDCVFTTPNATAVSVYSEKQLINDERPKAQARVLKRIDVIALAEASKVAYEAALNMIQLPQGAIPNPGIDAPTLFFYGYDYDQGSEKGLYMALLWLYSVWMYSMDPAFGESHTGFFTYSDANPIDKAKIVSYQWDSGSARAAQPSLDCLGIVISDHYAIGEPSYAMSRRLDVSRIVSAIADLKKLEYFAGPVWSIAVAPVSVGYNGQNAKNVDTEDPSRNYIHTWRGAYTRQSTQCYGVDSNAQRLYVVSRDYDPDTHNPYTYVTEDSVYTSNSCTIATEKSLSSPYTVTECNDILHYGSYKCLSPEKAFVQLYYSISPGEFSWSISSSFYNKNTGADVASTNFKVIHPSGSEESVEVQNRITSSGGYDIAQSESGYIVAPATISRNSVSSRGNTVWNIECDFSDIWGLLKGKFAKWQLPDLLVGNASHDAYVQAPTINSVPSDAYGSYNTSADFRSPFIELYLTGLYNVPGSSAYVYTVFKLTNKALERDSSA